MSKQSPRYPVRKHPLSQPPPLPLLVCGCSLYNLRSRVSKLFATINNKPVRIIQFCLFSYLDFWFEHRTTKRNEWQQIFREFTHKVRTAALPVNVLPSFHTISSSNTTFNISVISQVTVLRVSVESWPSSGPYIWNLWAGLIWRLKYKIYKNKTRSEVSYVRAWWWPRLDWNS